MKFPSRILSRRGFIASSILGGLVAPFLKPDRVEAAPLASFSPQVKITALGVAYASLPIVSMGFTKIGGDIGHFSVQDPASVVEVTYQGRISVNFGASGVTWVFFQLRVDGNMPLTNTGQTYLRREESLQHILVNFSGTYQNLAAGDHVVSMWSYASSSGATGSTLNPAAVGTTNVIIKEYLPFGSTYLPAIMN